MGRKKKFLNNTPYPDWAIERFARCIYDDVIAAYQDPEFRREYEEWEAEQKKKKQEQRKRNKQEKV